MEVSVLWHAAREINQGQRSAGFGAWRRTQHIRREDFSRKVREQLRGLWPANGFRPKARLRDEDADVFHQSRRKESFSFAPRGAGTREITAQKTDKAPKEHL